MPPEEEVKTESTPQEQTTETTTATAEPVKASEGLKTPKETPAATPKAPKWLPDADADTIDYLAKKGWDKQADPAASILQSYRNLEKVIGGKGKGVEDMMPTPTDNTSPEDWDKIYTKLGRPETADKYEYGELSNVSKDMAEGAPEAFHKLGLTQAQAKGLVEWYNQGADAVVKEQTDTMFTQSVDQQASLKKEWGAAHDQNVQIAKEAAAKLEWDESIIDKLQSVLGYDGVMKVAHNIGVKTGEGGFVRGEEGLREGGAMTPQQAQKELERIGGDEKFMKAWIDKNDPGHKAAVERKTRLAQWASS